MKRNDDLESLKMFMRRAMSVKEWNELREQAKKLFPIEVIRELDGSGFINQVLR